MTRGLPAPKVPWTGLFRYHRPVLLLLLSAVLLFTLWLQLSAERYSWGGSGEVVDRLWWKEKYSLSFAGWEVFGIAYQRERRGAV